MSSTSLIGSLLSHEVINHVQPTQKAVKNGPKDGLVDRPGKRDSNDRSKGKSSNSLCFTHQSSPCLVPDPFEPGRGHLGISDSVNN